MFEARIVLGLYWASTGQVQGLQRNTKNAAEKQRRKGGGNIACL